jgi:hypothetical protein
VVGESFSDSLPCALSGVDGPREWSNSHEIGYKGFGIDRTTHQDELAQSLSLDNSSSTRSLDGH